MMRELNLETWPRKGTYQFFKEYDQPFFGVTADLDVTALRKVVKERSGSFFITSLFLSLKAANELEPFRYRMDGDRVVVFDQIHGGTTVLNTDDTFSFCSLDYWPEYGAFERNASAVLARFKQGEKCLTPNDPRPNMIYYSVLPWISFTSFSHARRFDKTDAIPRMVFGGFREENGRWKLPLSVEVHHALMDGLHVGRYYQRLQELFDSF